MKTEKNSNERICIQRNEKEIQKVREITESLLPVVQAFLDEAKQLEIAVDSNSINAALNDPKKFALEDFQNDLAVEEVKQFGRLKTKPKNTLDNLEHPPIEKFIELAQTAKKILNAKGHGTAFFTIDNWIVKVCEEQMKTFANANSYFIDTPEQKEIWEASKAAAEAIEKMNIAYSKHTGVKNIEVHHLDEFITKELVNGKESFCPNLGRFHQHTVKFRIK